MTSPEITPATTAHVGWAHKLRFLLAGVVLTLAATACSGSSDDASLAFTEDEGETSNVVVETTTAAPQTTTTVAETTTTTLVDPQRELDLEAWKIAVSSQIPSVLTSSNSDAETLIELMCGLAETSNGESEFLDNPLATLAEELELTGDAIDLLARTSIELDCPEHSALTEG